MLISGVPPMTAPCASFHTAQTWLQQTLPFEATEAFDTVLRYRLDTVMREAIREGRGDILERCFCHMKRFDGYVGREMLYTACGAGQLALAKRLVERFDLRPETLSGENNRALEAAVEGRHDAVARWLLEVTKQGSEAISADTMRARIAGGQIAP